MDVGFCDILPKHRFMSGHRTAESQMKVRVFDPRPTEPSPAFEAQETPILGASQAGLVVQLGTAPGQVAYGDVVALSVFRSVEKGAEQGFLLFFLQARPRPLIVEAGQIRVAEFPIKPSASLLENLRQVAVHLCRQAGSMLVDRATLAFLKSGGTPNRIEHRIAAQATAFGTVLMPQASTASARETRPIPPPQPAPAAAAPAAATPVAPAPARAAPGPAVPKQPAAVKPPSLAGPTPISTQPMPQVRPIPPPPPVVVTPAASVLPPPDQPVPPTPPPGPDPPVVQPAAEPAKSMPVAPVPEPVMPTPVAPMPAQATPQPPTSVPAAMASPPAVVSVSASFQPMEIRLFDPVMTGGEGIYQPQEVFQVGGSTQGLEIVPDSVGSVAFTDVEGVAVFRSAEQGVQEDILLLVLRQWPQPLTVRPQQIVFDHFPIRTSASESENLRQLVLYLCQKAGTMVVDRVTGTFLRQGGPPPLLEQTVLGLATAFCHALPRESPPGVAGVMDPSPIPVGEMGGFAPSVAGEPVAGNPATGAPAGPANAFEAGFTAATEMPDADASYSEAISQASAPAPYSNVSALTYPMRGLAALVWVGMLVYLVASLLVVKGSPAVGLIALLNLIPMWCMPAIVLEVIRSTAHGSNTLEELPNFFEFGPRLGDFFSVALANLVPFLVALVLFFSVGITGLALSLDGSAGGVGVVGLVLLAAHLIILGILPMGLGAAATYDDWMLPVRVDLHLKAVFKCWKPILGIYFRLYVVMILGALALFGLSTQLPDPDPNSPSTVILALLPFLAFSGYLALDGLHLIGLVFRRHETTLADIYVYR